MVGSLEQISFEVPSNLSHSMTLTNNTNIISFYKPLLWAAKPKRGTDKRCVKDLD